MPSRSQFPDEIPGVHTARRLLKVGCAEQTVRKVLISDVGLTPLEAERAILAASIVPALAPMSIGSRPRLYPRPAGPTRRTER